MSSTADMNLPLWPVMKVINPYHRNIKIGVVLEGAATKRHFTSLFQMNVNHVGLKTHLVFFYLKNMTVF